MLDIRSEEKCCGPGSVRYLVAPVSSGGLDRIIPRFVTQSSGKES